MYYFIVNLTSRTGKAAKTWHQLKLELDQREVAYKAYVSEYPGHATRLAKMICNKADKDIRLIVVGGDGTANEVINGMEHFEKVTFGYIPSGSGNDLGRGLGISAKDPLEALQRILEAEQARYMDLGRVSWADDRGIRQSRLYAISAGIGFDALVCELALHAKLKTFLNRIGLGKLVYLILTVKSMRALQKDKLMRHDKIIRIFLTLFFIIALIYRMILKFIIATKLSIYHFTLVLLMRCV